MLTSGFLGRPLAFTELVAFLNDNQEWAGNISYALHLRDVTGLLVVVDGATYLVSKHAPRYYLIEAM